MTHASNPQPQHGAAADHGASHGASGQTADGHGSGHDATRGLEGPGPMDLRIWGAGILAAAAGLVVAACFVLATSGQGAY